MHTDAKNIFRELCAIRNTVIDILRTIYPQNTCSATLNKRAVGYVQSEFQNVVRQHGVCTKMIAFCDQLKTLSSKDLARIRLHCLFYVSEELAAYMAKRRIKQNALLSEEATLYVQERLYSNNFKRIRCYDKNKGASYKTYIWRVINNLITDFLIKKGKESKRTVHNEEIDYVVFSERAETFWENSSEISLDKEKLSKLVDNVILKNERTEKKQYDRSVFTKLPDNIDLSNKDRIFLNILYKHELNVNQVRKLPAFKMRQTEAYQLYYSILKRLQYGFKRAGVYEDIKIAL